MDGPKKGGGRDWYFSPDMGRWVVSESPQLSPLAAERIQIVGDLWQVVMNDRQSMNLSDLELAELDRCLDQLEQCPQLGQEWPSLKEQILTSR